MRVMVFVKATKDSEAGQMPTTEGLTEMGRFNEELVRAGIMEAGEGLHPSSRGKRVRFSGWSSISLASTTSPACRAPWSVPIDARPCLFDRATCCAASAVELAATAVASGRFFASHNRD